MAEGEFYTGGIQRFQREGYPTPNGVEFPSKDFQEKLEQLRAGDAAEIARKYKLGKAVEELLQQYSATELTPVICERFLFENQEFSEYHPALVRAVAEEIEIERNAQEAHRNTKH